MHSPRPSSIWSTLGVTLALLTAISCASDPTATPSPTPSAVDVVVETSGEVGGQVGDTAPDFRGIESWINSDPLSMAELRGQVVLVDFWTYTCVNCIRTLPYLREWHDKYADRGLVIVGVHSPEFAFEKIRENVVRSAGEYGVVWPIAQDNDFLTWRAYQNRFWPAKYLIDHLGVVRYTHFGEGAYGETEQQIRELLLQAGSDLSGTLPNDDPGPRLDPAARSGDLDTGLTRELYGGYLRNNSTSGVYVAHQEYYESPGEPVEYEDPGSHRNHFLYLQGLWRSTAESLVHARETTMQEDYIALKFSARSVNAVIDPQIDEPFEVFVTLDGRPLTNDEAGRDVIVEDGQSYFVVNEPRLYEVVALPKYGSHELTIGSDSTGFALFAFTFGGYPEGP